MHLHACLLIFHVCRDLAGEQFTVNFQPTAAVMFHPPLVNHKPSRQDPAWKFDIMHLAYVRHEVCLAVCQMMLCGCRLGVACMHAMWSKQPLQ